MHGVVSFLDVQHSRIVEELWEELERLLGIKGIYVTPFAHFSYQVAQHYDLQALSTALKHFAARYSPFDAQTAGLGIFTGPQPVLFVTVVRTPALTGFQRELWSVISKSGSEILDHYNPDRWVPHITIAQGDLRCDHVAEAVRILSERNFHWQFTVDNLGLIYDAGTQQEQRYRFPLGHGRSSSLS